MHEMNRGSIKDLDYCLVRRMWLAFYAGRIMEGTESIRQTLGMPAELLE